MFNKLKIFGFASVLVTGLFAVGADAQRIRKTVEPISLAPEASSYSLDQCRNGAVEDATNPDCIDTGNGNSGWVNGNAGASNSHWAESQFLAYRARLSGLTNGSHTIILQYDLKHSSKIAIDYLGSYNVTETDADPCSGVTPATSGCAGLPSTFLIPADPAVTSSINPNTGLPIVVAPPAQRQMTLWGGTITNVEYVEVPFTIDPAAAQQARTIRVSFTSNVPNPVLAWGGHVGWRGDWGVGNSAGGISGSPYHMRILELDGSGGNQDRSLSADAVDLSGGVIITKRVETVDNTDASTQAFTFTASAFFPNADDPQNVFQLVDNVAGSGGASRASSAIFQESNETTVLTVTEAATLGWTLLDVSCSDGDSTGDVGSATATISVTGGEIVTCTFVNGQQNASAASATVAGRVMTSTGLPISGATVIIQNLSTGEARYLLTNTYGRYGVKGLPVGDFYSVTVMHRRYRFPEGTQFFTLEDNLTDLDFTAR